MDLGGMDWDAFHALTNEEVIARALKDPDNLPITEEDRKRMKPRPRAYIIRRAFRMTQEEFAEAFSIPIGTLRDWEQGRTEPDQANRAYLKVIAVDPEFVRRALALRPGETMSGAGR
jgi:putative transcriptional regulator